MEAHSYTICDVVWCKKNEWTGHVVTDQCSLNSRILNEYGQTSSCMESWRFIIRLLSVQSKQQSRTSSFIKFVTGERIHTWVNEDGIRQAWRGSWTCIKPHRVIYKETIVSRDSNARSCIRDEKQWNIGKSRRNILEKTWISGGSYLGRCWMWQRHIYRRRVLGTLATNTNLTPYWNNFVFKLKREAIILHCEIQTTSLAFYDWLPALLTICNSWSVPGDKYISTYLFLGVSQ